MLHHITHVSAFPLGYLSVLCGHRLATLTEAIAVGDPPLPWVKQAVVCRRSTTHYTQDSSHSRNMCRSEVVLSGLDVLGCTQCMQLTW